MEKSSWDVITHELYFIFEAALDGCGDDSEQKKVMISGSSIRGLGIGRGRVISIAQRRADILSKL